MKTFFSVILAGCVVLGCATTPQSSSSLNIQPASISTDTVKKAAICIGLTKVNPVAYGNWDGDCPGCDVDAHGMYRMFATNGYESIMLLNSDATWDNIKMAVVNATQGFGKKDILVVMMSGHGGQIQDDNGDEADGLDETICLWDGQVRDDNVLKFIETLPPCRIVLINDQCHSEGNFRSMARGITRAFTLGYFGKRIAAPLFKKTSWSGEIIQLAGCREANYSYGSESGGTWTQSLLRKTSMSITWRSWFDSGKLLMPSSQVPVWSELNASDEFKNALVFGK